MNILQVTLTVTWSWKINAASFVHSNSKLYWMWEVDVTELRFPRGQFETSQKSKSLPLPNYILRSLVISGCHGNQANVMYPTYVKVHILPAFCGQFYSNRNRFFLAQKMEVLYCVFHTKLEPETLQIIMEMQKACNVLACLIGRHIMNLSMPHTYMSSLLIFQELFFIKWLYDLCMKKTSFHKKVGF